MLSLHRWTRYAKDRLYVTDEIGRIMGCLDLLTGETEVEPGTGVDPDEVRSLVEAWFCDHADSIPRRSVLCGAATPSQPRSKRELALRHTALSS